MEKVAEAVPFVSHLHLVLAYLYEELAVSDQPANWTYEPISLTHTVIRSGRPSHSRTRLATMTQSSTTNSSNNKHSQSDIASLGKAKEALWQYEVKTETFMQDVFDCIGILENDLDIRFDPVRKAKIAQELKRYVEFMDFVNEVLEDMILDAEAVKRYRQLQEDRALAQQTESAFRL